MDVNKLYETLLVDRKVFLTGQAGTGKTTLVNELKKKFRNPVSLGTTGVAAVLVGGETVHSFFKLGISNTMEELTAWDKNRMTQTKKDYYALLGWTSFLLRECDVIIIDEVSMMSSQLMEMILFRLESLGFSHIPILFVGDLLQLPPVKNETNTIIDHPRWKEWTIVYLTKIWRTSDNTFIEILNKIRRGEPDKQVNEFFYNNPKEQIKPRGDTIKNFTILTSINAKVNEINKSFLDANPQKLYKFDAEINITGQYATQKQVDEWLDFHAKVKKHLHLKVGSKVMTIMNVKPIDTDEDYVNGDTGVIMEINETDNVIWMKRDRDGKEIPIQKKEFAKSKYTKVNGELILEPEWTINQYPIILAYAITIHKSQGLSLPKVMIDARQIFAPSQFYVAVSRGTNPEGVYQLGYDPKVILNVNKRMVRFYEGLSEGAN